jgi:redox-sensitive bicupin YhaK (pirin superfamily)
VEFYDTHLTAGADLPAPSRLGYDLWVYVFAGEIVSNDRKLLKGDAATYLDEAPPRVRAVIPSDLVCILLDRTASFTMTGTRSGAAAPAIVSRVTLHG